MAETEGIEAVTAEMPVPDMIRGTRGIEKILLVLSMVGTYTAERIPLTSTEGSLRHREKL